MRNTAALLFGQISLEKSNCKILPFKIMDLYLDLY